MADQTICGSFCPSWAHLRQPSACDHFEQKSADVLIALVSITDGDQFGAGLRAGFHGRLL